MKKAFTIVELLVAVALLAMLMAISSMVFAAAVKAYRTAGAANEIAAKLQVMTQQLDDDLRGLRKDGEFFLIWGPSPVSATKEGQFVDVNHDNKIPDPLDIQENNGSGDGVPDKYISFDRMYFFADVDSQTYNDQTLKSPPGGTKQIRSNLARICYSFGYDEQGNSAGLEPLERKRLFCRTQHLISGDADLPSFPNMTTWDPVQFRIDNFKKEYQTMTMEDWLNLNTTNIYAKYEMLSAILDVTVDTTPVTDYTGGLKVDLNDPHNLFSQGTGQFHVQIWRSDLNRWWPEIDPDGDGIYNETPGGTDYQLDPSDNRQIDIHTLNGIWIGGDTSAYNNDFTKYKTISFDYNKVGTALKFTFTLYDSNGVFKDGKTFTHIVYLNN